MRHLHLATSPIAQSYVRELDRVGNPWTLPPTGMDCSTSRVEPPAFHAEKLPQFVHAPTLY